MPSATRCFCVTFNDLCKSFQCAPSHGVINALFTLCAHTQGATKINNVARPAEFNNLLHRSRSAAAVLASSESKIDFSDIESDFFDPDEDDFDDDLLIFPASPLPPPLPLPFPRDDKDDDSAAPPPLPPLDASLFFPSSRGPNASVAPLSLNAFIRRACARARAPPPSPPTTTPPRTVRRPSRPTAARSPRAASRTRDECDVSDSKTASPRRTARTAARDARAVVAISDDDDGD
mmetsp:Transcript_8811/g.32755  ORF Transcript_8811/g.32755 Transcript_8811/m.32755 type:complete len:234 (+) Transcript_8811:668-1369(+)